MLSIFTLGAQRMAIDPALLRASATPGLTCASVWIEEIPAMAIPPRAAPVVLIKSLLLDMPTTPFGISIVDSLKVLAFSRRDNTLFWQQFKSLYKNSAYALQIAIRTAARNNFFSDVNLWETGSFPND
jgi:hypothetical protein